MVLPTSLVPGGKAVGAIPASPPGACISISRGEIYLYKIMSATVTVYVVRTRRHVGNEI